MPPSHKRDTMATAGPPSGHSRLRDRSHPGADPAAFLLVFPLFTALTLSLSCDLEALRGWALESFSSADSWVSRWGPSEHSKIPQLRGLRGLPLCPPPWLLRCLSWGCGRDPGLWFFLSQLFVARDQEGGCRNCMMSPQGLSGLPPPVLPAQPATRQGPRQEVCGAGAGAGAPFSWPPATLLRCGLGLGSPWGLRVTGGPNPRLPGCAF